jgi:hypothetical protein
MHKIAMASIGALICLIMPEGASALDCNQFSSVTQLDQRLECLQKNNDDLMKEIKSMKDDSGYVRYENHILNIVGGGGALCLTQGVASAFAGCRPPQPEGDQRFRLYRLQQ